MHDAIVVGAGAAGIAAVIYARRKEMKTLLVSQDVGGQILISGDIENYPGFKHTDGLELAKLMKEHYQSLKPDEEIGEIVTKIEKIEGGYKVVTKSGKEFSGKTLIWAAGARHKPLNVPGEKELSGKGVSYCAICDGPLFRGKAIAIVGTGNTGCEDALYLRNLASKLYLLSNKEAMSCDVIYQNEIKKDSRVNVVYNAVTAEILGSDRVSGLKYKDAKTGQKNTLEIQGIFVAVGILPNTEALKGLVELNQWGYIPIDRHGRTSAPGIFAAGDATDCPYKQIGTSVGEGSTAALSAYDYLLKEYNR